MGRVYRRRWGWGSSQKRAQPLTPSPRRPQPRSRLRERWCDRLEGCRRGRRQLPRSSSSRWPQSWRKAVERRPERWTLRSGASVTTDSCVTVCRRTVDDVCWPPQGPLLLHRRPQALLEPLESALRCVDIGRARQEGPALEQALASVEQACRKRREECEVGDCPCDDSCAARSSQSQLV